MPDWGPILGSRGGPPQPARRGWGPAVLLAAALLALPACSKGDAPPAGAAPSGAALFDRHCARCHGDKGTGSERGPSLLDPSYAPSTRPDADLYSAVTDGVRAYRWHFGDMPRIGGLNKAEVQAVVAYVRGLQRAAGLK